MLNISIESKLPQTEKSIFSKMSAIANEYKAINLSQGFPNFDPDFTLIELVHKYMKAGKNQYAPMAGTPELLNAIQLKIKAHRGLEIHEDQLCITAGATQAIYTAISAVVKPGDEVICIDPAYDSYKPAIITNGGQPISYGLEAPEFSIDWDKFEALMNAKTKLIILNNPHNPLGICYSKEDLTKLGQLAEKYGCLVISDEVYEHLVFDDQKHISALEIPALKDRSFVTYSFGKTFHITGWKMGYCIASPLLMEEFKKIHQFTVFSVNTPAQLAIAEFLGMNTWKTLPTFFQKKRDLLMQYLDQSPFQVKASAGTYFQLVDYSEISQQVDTEYAMELIKSIGVATIPVSVFYDQAPKQQLLRICFAKTDELLHQAGERIISLDN